MRTQKKPDSDGFCGFQKMPKESGIIHGSKDVQLMRTGCETPRFSHMRGLLLATTENSRTRKKTLEEFIDRTGWEGLSAVNNDRAYLLEGDLMWTPRYLAGRCYLAKWFQPELFEDLDP
jgi:uncharacterized protein (UPF0297 family)